MAHVKRVLLLMVISSVCTAGCVRRDQVVHETDQPPALKGSAEVGFLQDPNQVFTFPSNDVQVVPASAWPDNMPPDYPQEALALDCGTGSVVLRIIVGPLGRVDNVQPSPQAPPEPSRCSELFYKASETALKGWRFNPQALRRFGPGPDYDGDGKPDAKMMLDQQFQTVYFDVRCDFRVENDAGMRD